MPNYFEQFNANVAAFNNKYNLEFNVDEMIEQAREKGWDAAYWHTYSDLASSLADKKIDGEQLPSLHEMMYDFETSLMTPFRRYRAEAGQNSPHVYGGMDSEMNRTAMINGVFEKKPKYDYQLVARDYMDGKIRIRDMVALTKESVGEGRTLSNEKAIELLKYSEALIYANNNRPSLWWLIHPFRYNAEKRDALLIRRLISEKFPLGITQHLKRAKNDVIPQIKTDMEAIKFRLEGNNEIVDEIKAYNFANEDFLKDVDEKDEIVFDKNEIENQRFGDDVLGNVKYDEFDRNLDFVSEDDLGEVKKVVDRMVEKGEEREFVFVDGNASDSEGVIDKNEVSRMVLGNEAEFIPDQKDNKAKNEPLKEEKKKVEQPKKKEAIKQAKPIAPLAKIGYRPEVNLASLRRDGNKLKNMVRDLQAQSKASEAMLEVVRENYKRVIEVHSSITQYGLDTVRVNYKNKEAEFARRDAALRERFPEYDPQPKVAENVAGNGERENINVDLGENKAMNLSGRIDGGSIKKDPPFAKK